MSSQGMTLPLQQKWHQNAHLEGLTKKPKKIMLSFRERHNPVFLVAWHGEPVLAQSLILISLLRSTLVEHLANVYKERITAL